jgi:hypothetical protein
MGSTAVRGLGTHRVGEAQEITVLGDTVNIASRIESMVAEAGQIVIGERTYELVKDRSRPGTWARWRSRDARRACGFTKSFRRRPVDAIDSTRRVRAERRNRALPPAEEEQAPGKILYSLIGLMLLTGLLPLLLTAYGRAPQPRSARSLERLLQLDQTRSIAQQAACICSRCNQLEAIAKTFEIGSDPRAVRSRILSVTPEALLDVIEEDRVRAITVFDREGRFVTAGYTLDDPAIEASLRESLVQGLQARPWTSPAHVSEPLLDTVVIMSAPCGRSTAERAPRRGCGRGDGQPQAIRKW